MTEPSSCPKIEVLMLNTFQGSRSSAIHCYRWNIGPSGLQRSFSIMWFNFIFFKVLYPIWNYLNVFLVYRLFPFLRMWVPWDQGPCWFYWPLFFWDVEQAWLRVGGNCWLSGFWMNAESHLLLWVQNPSYSHSWLTYVKSYRSSFFFGFYHLICNLFRQHIFIFDNRISMVALTCKSSNIYLLHFWLALLIILSF